MTLSNSLQFDRGKNSNLFIILIQKTSITKRQARHQEIQQQTASSGHKKSAQVHRKSKDETLQSIELTQQEYASQSESQSESEEVLYKTYCIR